MTNRYRANFYSGLANVPTTSGLVISGTGFPNLSIPAGQYMAITLNPGYYGINSNPEIMYIGPTTTSGVAQVIARAQEGTTAITGTNIPWVAAPVVSDFDVSNLTATGTLTASGGIITPTLIATNSLTISNNLYFANYSSISNFPHGRMYANGTSTISGYSSTTSGYNTIQMQSAFVNGGVTYSGNNLFVLTAGYYQVNASVGFSATASGDPSPGIYGIEAVVYNASGISTNYVASTAYLTNSSSQSGAVPETIVLSDIVYMGQGYSILLRGFNGASPTVPVYAGQVAGNATTYLSLSYVGT